MKLSPKVIQSEINEISSLLGHFESTFWGLVKIEPQTWHLGQYEENGTAWVIAVIGNKCLYFNHVEKGWGWGTFVKWGSITGHHWQQDEIVGAVYYMTSNFQIPGSG